MWVWRLGFLKGAGGFIVQFWLVEFEIWCWIEPLQNITKLELDRSNFKHTRARICSTKPNFELQKAWIQTFSARNELKVGPNLENSKSGTKYFSPLEFLFFTLNFTKYPKITNILALLHDY